MAIELYTKAFWNLCFVFAEIQQAQSQRDLQDVTLFSRDKIRHLNLLGNLKYINYNLLPEHHFEVLKEKPERQRELLELAEQEGLKPAQLRQLIRDNNKKVSSKDGKINVNGFGRCMILLENELKGMDTATRARALSEVTNSILRIK